MRKLFMGVGAGLLVLLGIGTIWDFEIATAVFRKGNAFSYFFEHFAPVVLGTIVVLAASLLLFSYDFKKSKKFFLVLSGFFYVLFIMFGGVLVINYIDNIGFIYLFIIAPVSGFFVSRIPKEYGNQCRRVGAAIVLAILASMVLVESIKPMVGRVRFRSMQDNFDLFTRWYQANGKTYLSFVPSKEEIKSFPSGHSQWAGSTLLLSLLATIQPSWRKYEKKLFLGALVYAGIIMFSRMMQGAHFLSDVTVGFSSAFVFLLILRRLLVVKKEGGEGHLS
ncbi:phosphatase PAP2 family protein [uncultured Vagococcus sp.]|uniref:phosphatase PAP2 family protein n=1 Tax=uncultured Vagococcus sp. TaxID=189676 RepID=UPI0028D41CF2|nr:phosphatase PAP2 family protein [uncultured Vagococcus sp.]